MRNLLLCGAASAALMLGAASAHAAGLLYSFETTDTPALDGFAANGGGISVTQSTIGATVGTGSMRNNSVAGATFTGALTSLIPANFTADTGSISLDLTINQGEQFLGAFADIGITIFGAIGSGASETFGNQFQVDASSEQNIAMAPGTYHLNIPLIGTSPVTFGLHEGLPTVVGEGFIPTGFEFFYSKSNDSAATVYIDNVQGVAVPEPTSLVAGAAIGGLALMRRRRTA